MDIIDKINKVLTEKTSSITKEMFDSIDWKYLDKAISKIVNTPISFIVKYNGGNITVTTKNLADKAGVFSAALKELVISNWGSVSLVTGDGQDQLYLDLKYQYKHTGGGSNGTDLETIWWMFDDNRWVTHGNKPL